MRPTWSQSLAVVPVALMATALVGCSTTASTATGSPTPAVSPSAVSSPPTPSPSGPAPDPTATTSVLVTEPTGDAHSPGSVPVQRPDATPGSERIVGTAGTMTRPVAYPDGLKVTIVGVSRGTVSDQGPGAVLGAPYRLFDIRFENGTTKPVDLHQVVVSAYYGKNLQAQPVYYADLQDFATTVRPGANAKAGYAFSIPADDRGPVTLTVDFDGEHAVAVFTGRTPS